MMDLDLLALRPARCEKLQAVSYVNLALSLFILVGILVSYLPQHYRIIARRTSKGISPYFILLGTTSGTSAFANILLLPASRADVACCKTVSSFECFAGLLGIAQVGVQWACFTVILVLFLIFFPRDPSDLARPSHADAPKANQPTFRTAVFVGILCLLHGFIVIVTSATLFVARPSSLGLWANILGITSAVLAAIQYLPQIYTTYTLRHVGSLSIPMMLIQTPGSFLWAGSLAARLGSEGWSTWGTYLVSGMLQGCLLVMGVIFEIRARKARGDGEETARNRINTPTGESRLLHPAQHVETDDEGGPVVENGFKRHRGSNAERTPLLHKSSSRKKSGP